jgi:hypothetical protein
MDANQVNNIVEGLRKHTKDVRVIGSDSTTGGKLDFSFYSCLAMFGQYSMCINKNLKLSCEKKNP